MSAVNTKKLGSAAAVNESRKRSSKRSFPVQIYVGLVIIFVTTFFPLFSSDLYLANAFVVVNIFIAVAILQNFLLFDGGQFSFGSGAIFGVGAYVTAIALNLHDLPYFVAAGIGTLAATVVGGLYALPALRVQGFYLGFVTFSVAMVFPDILVMFDKYTNGINGLASYVTFLEKSVIGDVKLIALLSGLLAVSALMFYYYIKNTVLGRRLQVASESPEAAMTLGISPGLMRFIAFFVMAFGTGIAGALYAPAIGFMTPAAFHVDLSILFFFAVIVGGRGEYLGPFVGILVLYLVPNVLLAEYVDYRLLAYGAITLLVATLFPEGVVGFFVRKIKTYTRKERDFNITSDVILNALEQRKHSKASTSVVTESSLGNVIEIKKVSKAFGHVKAVDDVSFNVKKGTVHALIGANGSGKTTLLNILTGLVHPDSGEIIINGTSTVGMKPYRISKLGLGRTFQTPRIFGAIDVWKNLEVGLDASPDKKLFESTLKETRTNLEGNDIELVPHGQRRLLEVMRIVLKDAGIIMLDEPAAGLSTTERREFKALIRTLSEKYGKTIVLVEHDIDLIWDVADRITVLEAGKHVVTDDPDVVSRNENVQHLFVESHHAKG
ncbi:ATP-binding cassette domain-containing protein [uncultured Marinobacter sp.]|uniref:branched-chain amino acid ABC transporter ATP-binding protein/permease n=1 Tax=uncultured Marinobacter sp. TaxID=187379 RepID=UPI00262FB3EC|nr:ATP-binding cassette domain-containing protein [uncultured Marinobacter sp.]